MLFQYEATTKNGVLRSGRFEAGSEAEIAAILENRRLTPISIRPVGGDTNPAGAVDKRIHQFSLLDKVLLLRNLAVSLEAGLSIDETLDIMIADASKKSVQEFLIFAKDRVESGLPLSTAFARFPQMFPPLFVGTIRVGEASGKLAHSCQELSDYLLRDYQFSRRVKSALAYPLLLFAAAFGVAVLLLVFVLPRISKIFIQSGVELPIVTRLLVFISDFLRNHLIVDVGIVALLGAVMYSVFGTYKGRQLMLSFCMRLPLLRDLIKKIALARFARSLSSLLGSGLTILEALTLSADASGNEVYRQSILSVREAVSKGETLASNFEKDTELYPHFFVGFMAVGERAGTVDQMLKNVASFYDSEIDQHLKDVTTFVEPILLIIMGVIVAAIVFSILLPIYRLVGGLI